jgi:hypothetical protein
MNIGFSTYDNYYMHFKQIFVVISTSISGSLGLPGIEVGPACMEGMTSNYKLPKKRKKEERGQTETGRLGLHTFRKIYVVVATNEG